MKIDKGTLDKIKSLDDEALKNAIGVVADITGADQKQRKKALDNVKTIRKKINSTSEKDIDKTVKKLGVDEPTIDEILSKLDLK